MTASSVSESSSNYEALFAASPSPFLILTSDLVICDVNEAYLAATARGRDELIGMPLFEAFPDNPDDPAADGVKNLAASLARAIETGKPDAMALQKYDIPVPPDGHFEERWWSPTNTPVLDAEGSVTLLIHHVEDVTEFVKEQQQRERNDVRLAQMEAELYTRGRRLEEATKREREAQAESDRRADATAAFTFVSDGVMLVDAGGIVRSWNRAAERITGLSGSAVVGHGLERALEGWSEIAEKVPLAATGAAPLTRDTLPLRVGGRELWLSITGARFERGAVYIFTDVGGERELERMRSDLIATVSHELRTPLAAIFGAAITLRRGDLSLDQPGREQFLEMIETQTRRLTSIVEEILLASRLESGEVTLSPAATDPVQLARETVDAALTAAPEAEVTLVEPSDVVDPAIFDAEKVQQILRNLVENAIRYSHGTPWIEMRVHASDRWLCFGVSDHGVGIAPEDQERVFEKFYRVDSNMTEGVGGTGLGLYICRELARRMGGRLSLESVSGEGSVFTLEIPRQPR